MESDIEEVLKWYKTSDVKCLLTQKFGIFRVFSDDKVFYIKNSNSNKILFAFPDRFKRDVRPAIKICDKLLISAKMGDKYTFTFIDRNGKMEAKHTPSYIIWAMNEKYYVFTSEDILSVLPSSLMIPGIIYSNEDIMYKHSFKKIFEIDPDTGAPIRMHVTLTLTRNDLCVFNIIDPRKDGYQQKYSYIMNIITGFMSDKLPYVSSISIYGSYITFDNPERCDETILASISQLDRTIVVESMSVIRWVNSSVRDILWLGTIDFTFEDLIIVIDGHHLYLQRVVSCVPEIYSLKKLLTPIFSVKKFIDGLSIINYPKPGSTSFLSFESVSDFIFNRDI
jgi:hypothetical protein